MPRKGYKQTSEHRAKLSAAHLGHPVSDELRARMMGDGNPAKRIEVRAKIGAASRGRTLSAESRAKVSAGLKDYYSSRPHPGLGRECTAETRAAISQTLTGRRPSTEELERKNKVLRSPECRQKMRQAMLKSAAHAQAVQSPEFKKKQSDALRLRSYGRQGFREDLGIYVRSSWEANYARYLNLLVQRNEITSWRYEPIRFEFPGIKRGVRSYLPDFQVTLKNGTVEYHEVKGYLTQRGRTALNRFKKHYPQETLIVIDKEPYEKIVQNRAIDIEQWER